MDLKQRRKQAPITTGAAIIIAVVANACGQQGASGDAVTPAAATEATAAAGIPQNVPRSAAQAMQLAKKWHPDAQMIDLRVRESNNYVLEADFMSPSDKSTLYVQLVKGRFTSQVMPPVTTSATGEPLPLNFLDLPLAIAKAEQRGMPSVIKEADLQAFGKGNPPLIWAIQPETDNPPYLYKIDAATAESGANGPARQNDASNTRSVSAPQAASSPASVVMASGLLQKCLGITPGADKMSKGPGTQQYCKQLPGADIFDQAGRVFQAGDHAAAAQIVRRAADAGNAVAQLRVALMYDQGDGVPRSSKAAFAWYARAAAQGEPESQNQMGLFYEGGEGVDENWDLAAKLYQASAQQGWLKGQFSFGRAYQFGIGVPQDRQQAIAWYQKAAAQGHPDGAHWVNWLRDFTNNVGFRDDVERGIVMAGKLRFGATLYGGDPSGVTFHNSAQRALWLQGQSQRVDKEEAETFRRIRQADHEACLRAGRDNC